MCAKHQTITNFLNTNSNQGGKQNTKTKKMRQTSFGFCFSLDLSTKSGALKYISWKKETKADRPLCDRGIVKESLLPIKESPQESQLSSSNAAIVKGSPLPCPGISALLSFAEWGISAYIVKESPLPDWGISACYSKNHRWISAIGKESQLTDQRIIQESLLLSSRNLLLLTEESPLADQRIIE